MPRQLKAAEYFESGVVPLRILRMDYQNDVDRHRHQFSELVVITGGQGVHMAGNAEYPIGTGDVFVLDTSVEHGYRNAKDLSLINILYDPAALQIPEHDIRSLPGYHALFTLEPCYRVRHKFRSRLRLSIEALAQVDALVGQVEAELRGRRPGFQYLSVAGFMSLIGLLCRCYSETRTPTARSLLRLGGVISHLERHVREPLNIAALIRLAGMSESSLRRAFREATGYAPIDYLIRLRIARAARLLRTSDTRVSEIAWQTGFEDSNYFTRQFRAVMGRSPRAYRNAVELISGN